MVKIFKGMLTKCNVSDLKVGCLYVSNNTGKYYAVIDKDDELIYTRSGVIMSNSSIDNIKNHRTEGVWVNIGDSIIINNRAIRNFYIDPKDSDNSKVFYLKGEFTKTELLAFKELCNFNFSGQLHRIVKLEEIIKHPVRLWVLHIFISLHDKLYRSICNIRANCFKHIFNEDDNITISKSSIES